MNNTVSVMKFIIILTLQGNFVGKAGAKARQNCLSLDRNDRVDQTLDRQIERRCVHKTKVTDGGFWIAVPSVGLVEMSGLFKEVIRNVLVDCFNKF